MKCTRLTMSGQTEWCLLPHKDQWGEERGGGEGERRGWKGGGSVNLWFRCDITK